MYYILLINHSYHEYALSALSLLPTAVKSFGDACISAFLIIWVEVHSDNLPYLLSTMCTHRLVQLLLLQHDTCIPTNRTYLLTNLYTYTSKPPTKIGYKIIISTPPLKTTQAEKVSKT